MKFFYGVFFILSAIVIGITFYFKTESTQFFGIADTKEIVINSDSPVEIKDIAVVQGQTVNVGDTLVVLHQPELTMLINEISHTLNEYKATKKFQTNFSQSELKKFKAEQIERANEISVQIRELEMQYETNKKLVQALRSVKEDQVDKNDSSSNPILAQIQSLKQLLVSVRNPAQAEIDRLNTVLTTENDPVESQIQRYTNELALLQEKERQLVKCAQISGVIGMVKFKDGEKVSPFDTILTLHTTSPSYAKGYIHENLYSQIKIGDTVTVTPVTDKTQVMFGNVVGVGSRIVEYPVRLLKRPDVQVWGREVLIKLPNNNALLLGEKVLISPLDASRIKLPVFQKQQVMVNDTINTIEEMPKIPVNPDIKDIKVNVDLTKETIEASGLAFLPDIASYIVISDETEGKTPFLFLMDENGNVGEKIKIDGLSEINDMESITTNDQHFYYILSSQSYNKKGKCPPARKLFIRVQRDGKSFKLDRSIYLFDLLQTAASKTADPRLTEFVNQSALDQSVDVEGMTIFNDTLLLGFKNPKIKDEAVILAVANYNSCFDQNNISEQQVSIWRTIPIYDRNLNTYCGISDLKSYKGKLYGLSTGVVSKNGIDEDTGLFWEYTPSSNEFMVIQSFPGVKPEGLAINETTGKFLIVFDNGAKNPSQFITTKG
jgi:multidrug resistance efflux pump